MKTNVKPKKKGWSHLNFAAICDICGKHRGNAKFDHTACSKARQAAGWLDDQVTTDEQPSA